MQFQRQIDQTQPLPAEYIGKIVSRPIECLPIVNARLVRSTTELFLGNRGIEILHGFDIFPNLECLWLNNNQLSSIDNLDTNFRIKRLYASHNRISTMRGSLIVFKHLEELDLSNNAIANLERILEIIHFFPLLQKLWLHHNPVAQEVDYRLRIIAKVPSLLMLDNVLITLEERKVAVQKYGKSSSPVPNDSLTSHSSSQILSATALETRIAHANHALTHANLDNPVFTYDIPQYGPTVSRRSMADHENSVAASSLGSGMGPSGIPNGFGRSTSAFLVPRPDIVFGCKPGTTTIQKEFAREINSIKNKRLQAQLAHTQAEFAESARRHDWNVTLGNGSSSSAPVVTSALINITHPASTEDVVTKKVREGMIQRGVEPDLLTEASPYRQLMTVTTETIDEKGNKVSMTSMKKLPKHLRVDAKAQMLGMLAPVVPENRATHPIDPRLFGNIDTFGAPPPTASNPSSNSLSASLQFGNSMNLTRSPTPGTSSSSALQNTLGSDLLRTRLSSTLPPKLIDKLAATGVPPISEAQISKMVLSKTGLRLKPNRSKQETLARYGLGSQGMKDDTFLLSPNRTQKSTNALEALLNRTKPSANGGDAVLGSHVPVLPTITPSGRLGEWDKYKLRIIFTQSDADGSGELSRDEIKACLSACADYGFCVTSGDDDPTHTQNNFGLGGATSALLGTIDTNLATSTTTVYHQKLNTMLNAVFDAIDVDKSGTVTWKEFLDVVETGVVPPKEKESEKEAAAKAEALANAATSGSKSPKSKLPSLAKLSAPGTPSTGLRSPFGKKGATSTVDAASAMLLAASAILNQTNKKEKKPEPVRVPQIKFRSLTAEESNARAERYFRQAMDAWKRSQTIPLDAPDRNILLEKARKEMLASSERGNRLAFIAQALGGELDPPEKAPTPPRPRHDWIEFTSLVPMAEEAKRFQRGGRNYHIPYPGDEMDKDEERTLRILHPDPITLAEEEENTDLRRTRQLTSDKVVRTLGNDTWEKYRLKVKAKAPHVVHRIKEVV